MNYTNANDPDHQDKPTDWLNSSLIFARAISLILREGEGIVVDIVGDVTFQLDESVKKVIVFSREGQTVVTECEADLEEGQFVMVHDENPN
ncbi:hypothetical protein UFOVP1247_6 [uncultured Caudovirales phage]|uniref:Uncharacterized protein n=1 Tax=uncultured Caudovirales phage TaxID=2100421 RepID=A0A6J5PUC2_9CAUD|nr:hypothetical protein UFOVP970_46 [uncultured Caudovirales phage]CAB4193016.1 hypothetical protein UFOVP1247_6 [uncultured Caudovirales phage]